VRAGIDVSPLAQTRAGTARYLRGLLPELDRQPDLELVRLAFGGGGKAATIARDAVWYPLGLPRRSRAARLELLHCPTFRAPLRSTIPAVVTVHDVAVLRFPEVFNRWTRAYSRLAVPRAVGAADAVIAVSEFTKNELIELLAIPPDRIRVIPNAPDETFTPEGAAAAGEYLLAVGTLEPRKNLPALVEAAQRSRLELRVVGRRGWGNVELNGDGVRWLGEVPDTELASLYRGALCAAYISLYEGFGLPVLEAMACGTPVVTSAGSAMEEVAGPAAVLVDPRDPEAIAAGIGQALRRREELAQLGLERARGFSWAKVAAETASVYRELG